MTQYDNNMRGVLFKNNKKESDKHPDYKGEVNIEGIEYWQSAWINEDKNGKKYMSQKFEKKEQNTQQTNYANKDNPPF